MRESYSWLPAGYSLDECNPDILILHRLDNSIVTAFSTGGATKEGIRKAADEDQQQDHSGPKQHAAPSPVATPFLMSKS
jgi:hypothetical protein